MKETLRFGVAVVINVAKRDDNLASGEYTPGTTEVRPPGDAPSLRGTREVLELLGRGLGLTLLALVPETHGVSHG